MKKIEESFIDWESSTFGFGYGTGEEYTLAALKAFMSMVGFGEPGDRQHCYNHKTLADALTPTVAWLLINTLCKADILEYGTSPRYGWLTDKGEALKAFVDSKSVQELEALVHVDQDYVHCYPDACNCGPGGYEAGRKCLNPFWSAS